MRFNSSLFRKAPKREVFDVSNFPILECHVHAAPSQQFYIALPTGTRLLQLPYGRLCDRKKEKLR